MTQPLACATCGTSLDADQRYCLECGARRGPVRAALPQDDHLLVVGPPEGGAADARWQRFGGVWGVAALLLVALAAGVVIGRSGDDAAPAAAAPVVRIAGAPVAAAGPTGVTAAVQQTAAADEWPGGTKGFTVQLALLPKSTTSQQAAEAAKQDALGKGAADVGVLDGDTHGLDAGQLILYSGVEKTRKAAAKRLKDLTAAYPDAKVVQVAAAGSDAAAAAASDADAGSSSSPSDSGDTQKLTKDELEAQENQSVEQAQKNAKKKPKTTVLPGKAPPKDDKAAGGGSDAETIG